MEGIKSINDENENENEISENEEILGKNQNEKEASSLPLKEEIGDQMVLEKNLNLEESKNLNFSQIIHKNSIENIDDIYHKYNHINPLSFRKSIYKKKKPEYISHKRQVAIKELITNLKTQYIIFNIKNFIKNFQIHSNPNIDKRLCKISFLLRNISLYAYGIIMLFERPWFCYKGTTIPLPSKFNFIEDCDKNVAFTNLPFIYNDISRIIEILFTLIITITQIMKYKVEYSLKETKTGVNRTYNIIQIILFITLALCLFDSIFSLIVKKFPIINFLCRPFIYIYMIGRLRVNWTSILKVLWKTKQAYFVLVLNLISFSIIGFALFQKKDGFFNSFGNSVLELYILLSTCNFPDIMLEAMEFSKFAFFYFFVCISINYFILLSYLNNLYTTKYYNVNKRDCLNIIRDVIDNDKNKYIYGAQEFTKFLLKQKYLYHLNDEEYTNILILLNIYNKNNDLYYQLVRTSELTPEVEMITNSKYGKLILESWRVEISVNILYFFCTITIMIWDFNNIIYSIAHLLFSLLIIYEPIILLIYIGFIRLFKKHLSRLLFHIFNLIVIVCLICSLFLHKDTSQYESLTRTLKLFISLRTIRIMIFLDKFKIVQNIFGIIRISKEMLFRNFLTLYSFILIFSTLSMLLTGGNIKKNAFDEEVQIPNNYQYINFNDFGSSYISCFCLLMINNLNILVKSLTFQSENKLFYQFYFATFYFFSTLILINIIQTLLLEMYLISDHSVSDKEMKKEDKKEDDMDIGQIIDNYEDD